MSEDCKPRLTYPKRLIHLPKKLKDRVLYEVFKEEKIKVNEDYVNKKCVNTNQYLLLNKRKNSLDTTGRQKIRISLTKKKPTTAPSKPYIEFMNTPDRRIVTWKTNIFQDVSQVSESKYFSICELMEIKVEHIIAEFTKFWTELGSNCSHEEKTKNAETMRHLFSVDFDEHLSRAIAIIPEELMSVPTQVAKFNCQPEASISFIIKKIVQCDIETEKQEKRTLGFGSSLPKELVNVPPNNDTKRRWIDLDAIPPDLLDMSAVWEGITHLKSSSDYYQWFKANWNVDPPPYLSSFYNKNPVTEPICDIKDLVEKLNISERFLPVLRDEEDFDIEELKKKAFDNL